MKKNRQKLSDFDRNFDEGKISIDFSGGVVTNGLSQVVKLSPMTIPAWLSVEIEHLSKMQANSKASVIRQLLVEAIKAKYQHLTPV